jgi:hypothetical protein
VNRRHARIAQNEALCRSVNEKIEEVTGASGGEYVSFICECGRDEHCTAEVPLMIPEYERVRSQDDRFLLKPGHETPDIERIVERTERYLIVDKIPAAEAFVQEDPRGAPSS